MTRTLFLLIFFSPLIMFIIQIIIFWMAKRSKLKKTNFIILIRLSCISAFIIAGLSLLPLIVWMIWYQITTGYDSGNVPVIWIVFCGPPSAALGQLIAIFVWWFKRPPIITNNSSKDESQGQNGGGINIDDSLNYEHFTLKKLFSKIINKK